MGLSTSDFKARSMQDIHRITDDTDPETVPLFGQNGDWLNLEEEVQFDKDYELLRRKTKRDSRIGIAIIVGATSVVIGLFCLFFF